MDEDFFVSDQLVNAEEPRRPRLIVFDVNETLSDMSSMAERFSEVGAPAPLAAPWFAGLLRDGFALTVTGANPSFADLARESLRLVLGGVAERGDDAVAHVMAGFGDLPVHPDVVQGVRALRALDITMVTLSNGGTSVAEGLLGRSGIDDCFARVLSVESAPLWKPAAAAYSFALRTCEVEASRAMLVAVHPWDIHGAHQAGMATAWVNRSGGDYPAYFEQPDFRATSLTDLASQLSPLTQGRP